MSKPFKLIIYFYLPFIVKYKFRFFGLFLMPILWCVAETSAPYLIKVIIDEISLGGKQGNNNIANVLVSSAIIYIALMFVMEASIRLCNFIWIQTIPQLKTEIRTKGLKDFQKQSFSFFCFTPLGDLVSKFRNLSQCFDQILSQMLYGIYPTMISSIVIFIFILNISKFFAVFFCFWYIGMNWITYHFAKKSFYTSNAQAFAENKLLGHIGDLFRNSISTRIFSSNCIDDALTQKFQTRELLESKKLEKISFYTDSLRGLLSLAMLGIMMVSLTVGWKKGLITLGDFSFITAVCFYARRSAWMASLQLFSLFKELGILSQTLDTVPAVSEKKPLGVRNPLAGGIDIKNVVFSYQNSHSLLKHINLCIAEGEKIGITGSSGSGKTSLIYLILGFFKPQQGSIEIGGVPLEQLSDKTLRDCISYVPQSVPLFHRTIYENIQYGSPSATKEEILRVAQKANCHEFIEKLENGYDTIIGEDGIKLSGGQRQRIALARALLKKAPILILDESFSALDQKNEIEILDNILSSKIKRTILLISHRKTSLEKMDRCIYLKNGLLITENFSKK